jgi:hypothetical protein
MSWIALADQTTGRFEINGLGRSSGTAPRAGKASEQNLLARGSIVIETRLSPDGRPQALLSYRRSHPWVSSFSLQAIPGGGIALIISQGDEVFHTALHHEARGRTDVLRITYSWDAPRRWGRLAVENPETDQVFMTTLSEPKPLSLADLDLMISDPLQRKLDSDVIYVAVSGDIEPLGPMPGLTDQVPVSTHIGHRPAGLLKRGDLVHTPAGDLVPVLQTIRRTVPARGSFQPVRLRAPYFGLKQDILVAPEQRLVISGTEVEYLFGRESVLVPARHLINGTSAIACSGPPTITYTHVILPGHEAVMAAGCPVESLYIGRIRRNAEMLGASLLAGVDRNTLPEHAQSVHPVLKPFEAITLVNQRAA